MKSGYPVGDWLAGAIAALALLGGCIDGPLQDAHQLRLGRIDAVEVSDEDPLPLLVPYRGLMVGIVEESAYEIFDLALGNGTPSDEEWAAAGLDAVNLIAVSTLLSMQGSGRADLSRYNEPAWRLLVDDMQNASVFVALATEQRNRKDLRRTANLLADTCQTCHEQFRIPPDRRASEFASR